MAKTTGEQDSAPTQEQLVEKPRAVLSTLETVEVVESLLAQSKEVTGRGPALPAYSSSPSVTASDSSFSCGRSSAAGHQRR